MTAERHDEVVACVAVVVVAEVAVRTRPVRAASSAASPKPASASWLAARVVDDREQDAPEIGEQHAPGREEDLVLDLDRVGRVEALARSGRRCTRAASTPGDPSTSTMRRRCHRPRTRVQYPPGVMISSWTGGVTASSCRNRTPARASPRGRQTSRAFLPPCNSAHWHAARSLSVLTRTRLVNAPRRRNPRDRHCRDRPYGRRRARRSRAGNDRGSTA